MEKEYDQKNNETPNVEEPTVAYKKTVVFTQQDNLPEDFHRGITKNELMNGIEQDLRKIYNKE